MDGQPRNNLCRLNNDGSLDTAFDPEARGYVSCLAIQEDGKILVGGSFTTLGGQPREKIGRLNPDGTLDSTFNPGAGADFVSVCSFAVQADGKILVGGWASTLGGQPRNAIGRLNPDGTVDSMFDPDVAGGGDVYASLALQADGKVLVGGAFSSLGGEPRNGMGRINNTGPATETLAHDGSTLTWMRGGSGPEVWRATFEHSADGLNWTFLGAGARTPGGWQLAGLSLSPESTVRARGYTSGGYGNSSGGVVGSHVGRPSGRRHLAVLGIFQVNFVTSKWPSRWSHSANPAISSLRKLGLDRSHLD